MSDDNAGISLGEAVPICPHGIEELRRTDADFVEDNAIAGGDVVDQYMDASVQGEDETGMGSIEHQVSAREEHFPRRRNGDSGVAAH
jgi:hypothetical protein